MKKKPVMSQTLWLVTWFIITKYIYFSVSALDWIHCFLPCRARRVRHLQPFPRQAPTFLPHTGHDTLSSIISSSITAQAKWPVRLFVLQFLLLHLRLIRGGTVKSPFPWKWVQLGPQTLLVGTSSAEPASFLHSCFDIVCQRLEKFATIFLVMK